METNQEKKIKYEVGNYWVLDRKGGYSVMVGGITHSSCDSTYERTDDGLSLAIARCDYLAKRRDK